MVTKKNVLFFGLIGPIVFLVASNYFRVCTYGTGCEQYYDSIGPIIIPVVLICFPVLLFSLVTYKMREEVFVAWMKFAVWWIPLTMFLVLVSSDQRSQSLPMPSEKGIIDIAMVFIFFVVSSIVIIAKRASLPPSQKK